MPARKRRSPPKSNENDDRKPAAKKMKPADEELVRRQAAASAKMAELGIQPDPLDSSKKRCRACGKYKSFELEGIKHCTSYKTGLHFCPLADDHSLYHEHQEKNADSKKAYNKRYYIPKG